MAPWRNTSTQGFLPKLSRKDEELSATAATRESVQQRSNSGIVFSPKNHHHHHHHTSSSSSSRSYLSRAEPRDGRQNAEGVAGQEQDAVGVASHARGLVVLDVVDGVRHARVLRPGGVGVVGLSVLLRPRRNRERNMLQTRRRAHNKRVSYVCLDARPSKAVCCFRFQALIHGSTETARKVAVTVMGFWEEHAGRGGGTICLQLLTARQTSTRATSTINTAKK